MASRRFENELRDQLRDPEFAAAYLTAAMDDDLIENRIDGLLHSMRELALSQEGGIAGTASEAKVGRQTIYDGLKSGGNPQIRTVVAILRTAGLRLAVQPVGDATQIHPT